ncbi:MAG: ribbon-helix-helix protein, CopG family [Verrucomicrobiota bacterium]
MATSKKRGAVRKESSKNVTFWIPNEMVEALDDLVTRQDTDRSKEIRKALRRHLRTPA